jgi:hypothetical protein
MSKRPEGVGAEYGEEWEVRIGLSPHDGDGFVLPPPIMAALLASICRPVRSMASGIRRRPSPNCSIISILRPPTSAALGRADQAVDLVLPGPLPGPSACEPAPIIHRVLRLSAVVHT